MDRDLKLTITHIDDGLIRVTWVDPMKVGVANVGYSITFFIVLVIGLLIGMYVTFTNETLVPMFIVLVLLIVGVLVLNSTCMVDNEITFGPEETTHRGQHFPTAEITRFEYGLKSQLTGQQPDRTSEEAQDDPSLIRMWLNDSNAYAISENNWQQQINHEIRDALAKALDAVRNIDKQESHEAEFGKTGDFGMPKY